MSKLPVIPGLEPHHIGVRIKAVSYRRVSFQSDKIDTEERMEVVGVLKSYIINERDSMFLLDFEGKASLEIDYDTGNLEVYLV